MDNKKVKSLNCKLWFVKFMLAVILPSFAFNTLSAAPWIDSGDQRLRHHIQLLADKNILTTPVTTWPLAWSSIIHDLKNASYDKLDEEAFWSVHYVKHSFARQTESDIRLNAQLSVGENTQAVKYFGDARREESEAKASIDWMGDKLAVHLAAGYAEEPLDGDQWRADGSYVSYALGNWALTAGAVDRWWGPGWHSSLTLSSNARPILGLSLQRRNSDAFKSAWLSWIGPWQFTSIAGQLESDRHLPDAYFLGARISFKPFNNLELALSRTAQWGGEGRPQSLSSLKDLIIGNDNRGDSGIAIDGSNEPGNQQASIDARYNFSLAQTSSALYFQFTGEDEAGGLPSRGLVQLGLESSFLYRNIQHRFVLEASDTSSESYSTKRPNYAYEHGIYRSGYRYKQRPIGASIDNDSRLISLSADHYLASGQQFSWSLAAIDLNTDTTNAGSPGGSVYGEGTEVSMATLKYALPLNEYWQASFVYHQTSESFTFNNKVLDSGASLILDFRY
ncbi:capsule assembly Wzi family protein [Pseudomonadales bacterium]|nr:capsule assembly Wzi family protein [Pseudomonadales bacterium]